MMHRLIPGILLVTLLLLNPSPVVFSEEEPGPDYEMTTYYVGFLYKGPAWSPEVTPEVERLQRQHLAHIRQMADSGDLLLAGPFTDGGDLRGMFVFQVDSIEKAQALAESDPAVKSGRLRIEMHPWYSAKGINIDRGPERPPEP